MRGGAGVGAFKKVFGGRKSRGTRPETSAKGSGSIARHILKQLEVLKILEKVPEGKGCVCPCAPLPAPRVFAQRDYGTVAEEGE
jgi:ribosomal protein S19E (S16A)